jgi:choline monooxygenase
VKNLVCKYHGWAFSAEGELLNARDFGAPAPEGAGLQAVAVDEWRGILFVCLSPEAQPLKEWLGGFPSALSEVPLETYSFYKRTSRTVRCNWKTYADNFLEGYHLPTVHPRMTRDGEAGSYSVELTEDQRWNIHRMPGRGESTFSLFGWFWPTFAFNALPGGFAIERWLPRGPHEIELIFEYMFEPGANAEASFSFSEEVGQEDVLICEHVQRNLASGMYDTGKLSPKWEEPLRSFHQLVREAVCPAAPVSVRDPRLKN